MQAESCNGHRHRWWSRSLSVCAIQEQRAAACQQSSGRLLRVQQSPPHAKLLPRLVALLGFLSLTHLLVPLPRCVTTGMAVNEHPAEPTGTALVSVFLCSFSICGLAALLMEQRNPALVGSGQLWARCFLGYFGNTQAKTSLSFQDRDLPPFMKQFASKQQRGTQKDGKRPTAIPIIRAYITQGT